MSERLLKRGISHLLLYRPIFTRWANSQFDDQGRGTLQHLFKQKLKHVFESHDYFLFQIPPDSGMGVEKSAG